MVRKLVKVRETHRVAKVCGLGLAVFLLASLTSAGAQQLAPAPAVQAEVAAKGTTNHATPSDAGKRPINDYTVSPEDLLDIYVLDVPEVTRIYRVSSNGFLTLPLLPEPIAAAGESLDQLAHLIATKFHDAGMLNNAQVTVSLKETKYHAILVSGEVGHAQSYPILGPTRLLDVLVQAGGLAVDASDDVIITRGDLGARADQEESARSGEVNPSAQERSFHLNIRKLVQTGDDKTNILLYPGDRLTVQRAELVYILGAVARPGGYVLNESRQQITVLKALAMAGDVNGVAKRSRIIILRRIPSDPEEKREEIPVNYKDMVQGKIDDVRLKPDDILYVPESTKLKALHTGVSSAVSLATMTAGGLAIYR